MFEGVDAVFLARLQFAFTVIFHFLFPSFTIGLASYLAVLEGLWLKTKNEIYLDLFKYWVKIFAVVFAMGVVSGIVMSYEFGSNWAKFSDKVGTVIGPLLAYEVLTAFFLEAGFLGVMLFGMNRVGRNVHFAATCLVAVGTLISSFWILSANSWMQTPQGYAIGPDGQFIPLDWAEVIFNPSFPYRLVHTIIATFVTTSFMVGAVGAWHLLKDKTNPHARKMFSMAMWMAAIVVPVQLVAGDQQGLNTQAHQPVKIMGMEGHFESYPNGAPLVLVGIPDQKEQKMKYAIEIPKLGSLIVVHDPNGALYGLKTVPLEDQPPVAVIFWSFRIMVGIGMLMLGMGLISLIARGKKKLYDWPWFLKLSVIMGPAGFIAITAGWVTTEVGRQPFTVYGLLRTADSASPLAAPAVGASLLAFIFVYFTVFGTGIWYMLKMMAQSPHDHNPGLETEPGPVRAAGITPAAQEVK